MDASPAARFRFRGRADLWVGLGVMGALALLARDLLVWDPAGALPDGTAELERFAFDAGGGHHMLGLLVCAGLIWRRRRDLVPEGDGSVPSVGALALGLAAAIASAWSAHTQAPGLLLPALAIWLLGVGWGLAGRRGLGVMGAPAAVLVVTMPLPVALVNVVIHPMQMATAATVSALLGALSIDHVRAAEYVYANEYIFYVVEGCAGLGILQTMLLAALAMGALLDYSAKGLLRLLACAVVIALGCNQLRVLTIVLLPESSLARDHEAQGLVMLVTSVVVLGLVDAGLLRLGRGGASAADDRAPAGETPGVSQAGVGRALALILGSAAVLVAAGVGAPRWKPPETTLPRAAEVSKELAGLRARRSLTLDREYLGSVRWSDRVFRRYVAAGPDSPLAIDALVLVDRGRDRSHDVGSAKVARTKPGLVVRHASTVPLPSTGHRAELLRADGPDGMETIVFLRAFSSSGAARLLRSALAVDQSHWHRSDPDVAVRLATARPVDAPLSGSEEEQLIRFADAFVRSLVETGLLPPIGAGRTENAGAG